MGRSQSGQAIVETAVVMPLFVFLILGLLQTVLLSQAHILTKYAAYKAARVGSIHSAKHSAMRREALAVLLPMTGRRTIDTYFQATVASYALSFATADALNGKGNLVDVTICEPTGRLTGDFDDPEGDLGASPTGTADWSQFNKGRLAIQVTNYHQMVIPFANMILWHVVAGRENAQTMRELRMNTRTPMFKPSRRTIDGAYVQGLAAQKIYVMPIRAGWSMRMQSDFLPSAGADFQLPASNQCAVPWPKK